VKNNSAWQDHAGDKREHIHHVFHRVVFAPDYGVPQRRSRLVLLASRLGSIALEPPTHVPSTYRIVRDVIGGLPPLEAGKMDPLDPLHRASGLSEKYRSGLMRILEEQGTPHEPIEIVALLGHPPEDWSLPDGRLSGTKALEAYGTRIVFYDELLSNAGKAYQDYFERRKLVDKLDEIIKAIEDYAPPDAP
jgi:hypothetical protein